MGEVKGFLEYDRVKLKKEKPSNRIKHSREFTKSLTPLVARKQGARCMDCGVPFCHNGCPIGNVIPEFNDLVSNNLWREALVSLSLTNNFPEFTGSVCPAPCESACVLGINADPVSIKNIELAIVDRGFSEGWIKPEPPMKRSGRSVAVIGSGPAGLAAAQQLNRKGHWVTVYERADRPGGLLMYGIPNFKLDKEKVLRRIKLMEAEGITFKCSVNVGFDVDVNELQASFDAVLLTCGATKPRDVEIKGRQLKGIHFADDLLRSHTKVTMGDQLCDSKVVSAKGKSVIVIGGGDTGSDCVGTSNRHGAKAVRQFEILDKPDDIGEFPRASERPANSQWPEWTQMLRTSTSHEEGVKRYWTLRTKEFVGNADGEVIGLITEKVRWLKRSKGRPDMEVIPDSQQFWSADLVLLAVGFLGPESEGIMEQLSLDTDVRGNVLAPMENYKTSAEGIFTAGDMRRGQSLVVWAIREGREAADSIDAYLYLKD